MAWKDESTKQAVQFYMRLFIGLVLALIAIYMALAGRIEIRELLAIVTAILSIDRLGHAIIARGGNADNS